MNYFVFKRKKQPILYITKPNIAAPTTNAAAQSVTASHTSMG